MKAVRIVLLVALAAFVLYVKLTTTVPLHESSPTPVNESSHQFRTDTPDPAIPAKALQVLQTVRQTGQPPEGYVGGRTFENHEGHLPAGGDYREFDVDPHNGPRNAERLIVEWNTKKAWYTGDHYQTFIPVP
jgi:ribonuclease T1